MEYEPSYIFKGPFKRGIYTFEGSEIHTFEVDLSSESVLEFKTYQNVPRQDFSVRMWISYEEKSLPLSWGNTLKNINLRKFPIDIRILYSENYNEYKNIYTFLVDNKKFYINYQNLENSKNGYRII